MKQKQQRVVVGSLSADCRLIIDRVIHERIGNDAPWQFNYDILLFPAMCGMYMNVQGLTQDIYLKEVE